MAPTPARRPRGLAAVVVSLAALRGCVYVDGLDPSATPVP